MNGFDLLIVDGANRYHLKELLISLTLVDVLNEIAYQASVNLKNISELSIYEGQQAAIIGHQGEYLLNPGVIWGVEKDNNRSKTVSVTIYDHSIYLKSEDEYVFPAGQTASQRLKQYAKDWNIPLAEIPDTNVPLARAVYRAQPIYAMIFSDLKETVKKGGAMYRPRITSEGLELFLIGSNSTVWQFETQKNIENYTEAGTLDTVVTQVKVLGSALNDERSPVLAVLKGETAQYGTIQKILTDEKITSVSEAKSKGQKVLRNLQRRYHINTIDVPTIRAGEKIKLDDTELIILSVTHTPGAPGRISMRAANIDFVRQEYYLD